MIDFASYQHFLRLSLEHDIRINVTSCLHDPIWLSGHVLRVSIDVTSCLQRVQEGIHSMDLFISLQMLV
jgi:hypothetical protein